MIIDNIDNFFSKILSNLAGQLGEVLKAKKLTLVTAESCTGGLVATTITSIPGSSDYFERGFITYSNQSKMEMLGVAEQTLLQYGAVSEPTARAMAEGALKYSHANVSIAITGVAGPGGGTIEKPVGTVCFAWALKSTNVGENSMNFLATKVIAQHFTGDRNQVRLQATEFALQELISLIA